MNDLSQKLDLFTNKHDVWFSDIYSLEWNTRNCSGCGSSGDDIQNLFQSQEAAAHSEGNLVGIVLSEKKTGTETQLELQLEEDKPLAGQGITWLSPGTETLLFLWRGKGLKPDTKWS